MRYTYAATKPAVCLSTRNMIGFHLQQAAVQERVKRDSFVEALACERFEEVVRHPCLHTSEVEMATVAPDAEFTADDLLHHWLRHVHQTDAPAGPFPVSPLRHVADLLRRADLNGVIVLLHGTTDERVDRFRDVVLRRVHCAKLLSASSIHAAVCMRRGKPAVKLPATAMDSRTSRKANGFVVACGVDLAQPIRGRPTDFAEALDMTLALGYFMHKLRAEEPQTYCPS